MKYRYRNDGEMKDSGVEWLGKIPKDWHRVRIGHICEIGRGRVISNEEILNNKGKYPVYSSQTKDNGVMGYISSFDFEGDYVTWTTDGANAGTVFKRSGKFNCTNVCGTLKNTTKNLNLSYLAYALSTETKPYVRLDINPKLMNNEIANIKVCMTNSIEQEKIANFLDEKTSQFGAIISKKEALIQRLEEAKKSLISEVVTGKVKVVKSDSGYELVKRCSDEMKYSGVEWLGEIPKEWEVKKFSHVIKISNGQVDPRMKPYSEMILIAPNHVKSGMGKIINLETANEQGADSGKYLCEKGDIIYSKIRPNLCKVCIAPIECLCSADMYPMKTDSKILNQEYLLWVLLSNNFTRYVVLESDRVAMPKVNRDSLAKFKIPTPQIEEQVLLNKILKQNDKVIDNLINKTKLQIEKLKEAKQSLISEAVTGKIEILD